MASNKLEYRQMVIQGVFILSALTLGFKALQLQVIDASFRWVLTQSQRGSGQRGDV